MPKLSNKAISVNKNIEDRVDIIKKGLLDSKNVKSGREFAESIGYLDSNLAKIGGSGNYSYSLSSIALLCVNFNINANWIVCGIGDTEQDFSISKLPSDNDKIEFQIKTRFFEFADNLINKSRFSSLYDISKSMGVHRQQLYTIKERVDKSLPPHMAAFMIENHALNANWLLTGEGDMFRR
ncbi:hypothetical protein JGH11_19595 [Dysgonomonas sp. Marseille-P4677]|uniref:hypothetical protein n=1 Tax=Dysgonomonas sp. Marseille-P4677 TaxID=2364790 RepID=UPI001912ADDB|nr:hypothetical protein [Dysgonomonas sp. Marseille-P4677]MBK5723075.1 hypothetical protein [Dysgonomonas sp. Marseille-P4677]